MVISVDSPWICCQLGAREHYAIPRALHHSQQLHSLITDAWVTPLSSLHYLPGQAVRALGDRYHLDLAKASVHAFTPSLISFELGQRLSRRTGWPGTIARNQWFQQHALRALRVVETQLSLRERPILFSYSYTARSLFRYAKQKGWRTVLGQIDPGITEEKQVAQLQATYCEQYPSTWTPAPANYWHSWQQECQLADHILVNSNWSRTALAAAGVSSDKVTVIPLAYQPTSTAKNFTRHYPEAFTPERPLRVLFLGQIILRKGIAAFLEALPYLATAPIEIWLVGSTELDLPASLREHPQLEWFGSVSRSQVQRYYQQADVFLFPTHSDGFGLTQLEAQAWQLPVVASPHCGEVVRHQQNGLILSEISGESVAEALIFCCRRPDQLRRWSVQSTDMSSYSLNRLAVNLQTLTHALV